MVKERNEKEKNTNKKILPFVMSTSMLTAALFGAGGAALADENSEDTTFKNHGEEVSSFAKSIPGSPEKGKIMRAIASKKWQEKAAGEDKADDSVDEDEDAETCLSMKTRMLNSLLKKTKRLMTLSMKTKM